MKVGVGVELARDQVVEFASARRKHECQAIDVGVGQTSVRRMTRSVTIETRGCRWLLSKYECEVEYEVFVVR